ncbi:Uncharacterized protein TCM_001881 [Theobroma cacao]|uniref:DUF295 domain-containing protein n=1 Tax=Theobroma cacao TaxID=3641 RepID=A0A061DK52_THECC|nr:Uncharacterized protein TCM_001881 [Theobroma cacao]
MSFKIFKLVLDDQSGELLEEKEVKNVDGDVAFVGDHHSVIVSTLDCPETQLHSIYFTNDHFIATIYWPLGPQVIVTSNAKSFIRLKENWDLDHNGAFRGWNGEAMEASDEDEDNDAYGDDNGVGQLRGGDLEMSDASNVAANKTGNDDWLQLSSF